MFQNGWANPSTGSVSLPFLRYQRTQTIQGDPGTQLEGYLAETVTVPPETIASSTSNAFALPPAQTKAKKGKRKRK